MFLRTRKECAEAIGQLGASSSTSSSMHGWGKSQIDAARAIKNSVIGSKRRKGVFSALGAIKALGMCIEISCERMVSAPDSVGLDEKEMFVHCAAAFASLASPTAPPGCPIPVAVDDDTYEKCAASLAKVLNLFVHRDDDDGSRAIVEAAARCLKVILESCKAVPLLLISGVKSYVQHGCVAVRQLSTVIISCASCKSSSVDASLDADDVECLFSMVQSKSPLCRISSLKALVAIAQTRPKFFVGVVSQSMLNWAEAISLLLKDAIAGVRMLACTWVNVWCALICADKVDSKNSVPDAVRAASAKLFSQSASSLITLCDLDTAIGERASHLLTDQVSSSTEMRAVLDSAGLIPSLVALVSKHQEVASDARSEIFGDEYANAAAVWDGASNSSNEDSFSSSMQANVYNHSSSLLEALAKMCRFNESSRREFVASGGIALIQSGLAARSKRVRLAALHCARTISLSCTNLASFLTQGDVVARMIAIVETQSVCRGDDGASLCLLAVSVLANVCVHFSSARSQVAKFLLGTGSKNILAAVDARKCSDPPIALEFFRMLKNVTCKCREESLAERIFAAVPASALLQWLELPDSASQSSGIKVECLGFFQNVSHGGTSATEKTIEYIQEARAAEEGKGQPGRSVLVNLLRCHLSGKYKPRVICAALRVVSNICAGSMRMKHFVVEELLNLLLQAATHKDDRVRYSALLALANITWASHRYIQQRSPWTAEGGEIDPRSTPPSLRRRGRRRAPPSFTELLERSENGDESEFGGEAMDETEDINEQVAVTERIARLLGRRAVSAEQRVRNIVQSLLEGTGGSGSSSADLDALLSSVVRRTSSTQTWEPFQRTTRTRENKLFAEICKTFRDAGGEKVVVGLIGDRVRRVSEVAQAIMRHLGDVAFAAGASQENAASASMSLI